MTVKHRVGIDHLDSDALLQAFVDRGSTAGATRFAVHARKAWLEGLDPKQNRTIPPLQYDRVIALKQRRPDLTIELNGGLDTPDQCLEALENATVPWLDGPRTPILRWGCIDERIYGEAARTVTASDVVLGLIPYAQAHLARGGRLWDLCRHLVQLVEGVPGARHWRRNLGLNAQRQGADIPVLEEAARQLLDAGL